VVDRLATLLQAAGAGLSRDITVDGVRVKLVRLSSAHVSVLAAVSRHRLLLTNSPVALRAALGTATSLADETNFKQALSAAGVPHDTTGFAYVNLQTTLPFAYSLAASSGAVPAVVRDNTRPVRSFVVYGSQDGDVVKLTGCVSIHYRLGCRRDGLERVPLHV
jgi:hypothetical protein